MGNVLNRFERPLVRKAQYECGPFTLYRDVCVAGVQDNDDVRVMLGGSSMVKVRSSRWQKSRTLRLLEDGVTVWCETAKSSRRAKAQQTCRCLFSSWF